MTAAAAAMRTGPLSVRARTRFNAVVDASLAAVIGAAVGALGGVGGGVVSSFGQGRQLRQQHAADRRQWKQGLRQAAYNELLAASKQLSNALWAASDKLHDQATTVSDWQAGYLEVHAAWTRFSAAAAAVSIAGPRTVADAADGFRRSMYEWEMICTTWTRVAIRSQAALVADHYPRFEAAAVAKRSSDRAFQAAARKALDTEN